MSGQQGRRDDEMARPVRRVRAVASWRQRVDVERLALVLLRIAAQPARRAESSKGDELS